MRLERIEINGFKSFSDRSELAFDRGVTAIVGPNGCGKSNVADAITWVMGEQSAKSLRGDRMEDVIFSGSDARKPTASAEVRLRLSGVLKLVSGPSFEDPVQRNPAGDPYGSKGYGGDSSHSNGSNGNGHVHGHADAEELIQSVARDVEVTRRLFRSGESEYLIDGRSCRLRDVHDLLMDTGLGAKAYAIIEQGKIGMILSSRPTDRRQLIEEAAGVTKYRARRRVAELKLEAARQNLTRIDDIVFEVEKQRGTLKRQAARARRYQKLRDELRRWEKVLFARRYRELAETIQTARERLAAARNEETTAGARVAAVETSLGGVRIDLVEAESRSTEAREAAHGRELSIARQQQQIALDREQIRLLTESAEKMRGELALFSARRAPAQHQLSSRHEAALDAARERQRAAAEMTSESDAYASAHREIEGLEADVEAARSEVFSAINAATALRHSVEHTGSARDRVLESLSKLQVESDSARLEEERTSGACAGATEGVRHAQQAAEATRIARSARESELASARIEHEWRSRMIRAREQELAALEARLVSLEELEKARAIFGDAPRAVLAEANGTVNQRGAVADYLEVEPGYERAVESCLGDLLQHVVVERAEHAAAGLELVRERSAGRCGFLISMLREGENGDDVERTAAHLAADGGVDSVRLSSVMRVVGPFAASIRSAVGEAWIVPSYQEAADLSRRTPGQVATTAGDLFRGPSLVSGGTPEQARGILETKRDIRTLRDRIGAEGSALTALIEEASTFEAVIAHAANAIAALNAEHHRQEKAIVALESQLQRASEEAVRVAQKREQLARERMQAEEERDALASREEEARAAIVRLDSDQRAADQRLTLAQHRLFESRESAEQLSRRAAEAQAAHATLVERAAGLEAEVRRLEETAAELEARAAALECDLEDLGGRVERLRAAVADGETKLATDVDALDSLRTSVAVADSRVLSLRGRAEELESELRISRGQLDAVRLSLSELDVARATAESDLSHLAATCLETVQKNLDDVLAEVEENEQAGSLVPDSIAVAAEEPDEAAADATETLSVEAGPTAEPERASTAEDAISLLRGRIERLGPVNMMAIDQFDELETRHSFLSTQRKDLVESIAQTGQAIARIDETTRQRFAEAFAAINRNFQETFTTLFGGGRAGLTLIDEADPLESGIEIVAQPPGKRLQSVQLLSGGEKALTAIALMFGLFKYKPSPFCLLDEIDAPLDDANIGRFVEMLRSMQQHTQFILITHNRKTMEIADRLYGVTMEEPGVSKLISVQLN